MNNINHLQNKKENLYLISSQKILYDNAKKFKYFSILCYIINIILNLTADFTEKTTLILIFVTIIRQIIILLENKSDSFNKSASIIQELFDRKIFKFNIETRHLKDIKISDIRYNVKKIQVKYPIKTNNNINNTDNDNPSGVKNWYSNIDQDLSQNEAILKCQKQNISWDENLIGYYIKILYNILFILINFIFFILFKNLFFSIIFIIISSLIFYSISSIHIKKILCFILFITMLFLLIFFNKDIFSISFIVFEPLLRTIYKEFGNIKEVENIYYDIEKEIYDIEILLEPKYSKNVLIEDKIKEELLNIQHKIFKRRSINFNVPSIIYKFYNRKK